MQFGDGGGEREFVDLDEPTRRAPCFAHWRHSSAPIEPPPPVTSTERPPSQPRIAFQSGITGLRPSRSSIATSFSSPGSERPIEHGDDAAADEVAQAGQVGLVAGDGHPDQRAEGRLQSGGLLPLADVGTNALDRLAPEGELLPILDDEVGHRCLSDAIVLAQVRDEERGALECGLCRTGDRQSKGGARRLAALVGLHEGASHDRRIALDGVDHDGVEHALLAAVVAVHGAGRDADALGDLGQAHGGIAPAGEQLGGDAEDRGLAIAGAAEPPGGGARRLDGSARRPAQRSFPRPRRASVASGDIVNESSLVRRIRQPV